MKKILAPVLCLSFSALCNADEAAIKAKFEIIQKITSTLKDTPSEDEQLKRSILSASTLNTSLAQSINQGQYNDLISRMDQFAHLPFPSNYTDALANLKQEIAQHIKETEVEELTQLKNLETRIKNEIIASKKPEDLDDLLSEISAVSKSFNGSYYRGTNKEMKSLQQTISNSASIISQWQNYLIAESVNDSKSCKRSLESISSSLAKTPIIPRSHVLRLLNPPATPTPTETGIGTNSTAEATPNFISFDAVEAALDTGTPLTEILEMFKKLSPDELKSSDTKRFQEAVKQLNSITKKADSMSLAELTSHLSKDSQTSRLIKSTSFTKARNKAVMMVLTKSYSALPATVKDDFTSPESLLKAAFSHYTKNKDWVNASSTATDQYDYAKFIGLSVTTPYRDNASALTSIARADSAVKAAELQLAIKNYRSAVGQTSNSAIFQAGFEGLKKLKESHPKEFLQESEYTKAIAAMRTEERLASMKQHATSRNRSLPDRGLSPELKKLVEELVKSELSESRTEKLDQSLETKK